MVRFKYLLLALQHHISFSSICILHTVQSQQLKSSVLLQTSHFDDLCHEARDLLLLKLSSEDTLWRLHCLLCYHRSELFCCYHLTYCGHQRDASEVHSNLKTTKIVLSRSHSPTADTLSLVADWVWRFRSDPTNWSRMPTVWCRYDECHLRTISIDMDGLCKWHESYELMLICKAGSQRHGSSKPCGSSLCQRPRMFSVDPSNLPKKRPSFAESSRAESWRSDFQPIVTSSFLIYVRNSAIDRIFTIFVCMTICLEMLWQWDAWKIFRSHARDFTRWELKHSVETRVAISHVVQVVVVCTVWFNGCAHRIETILNMPERYQWYWWVLGEAMPLTVRHGVYTLSTLPPRR